MIRTIGAGFGALLCVLFLQQIATPTPRVTVSISATSVIVLAQR